MEPERVARAAIRFRRRVFTARSHKIAVHVAAIALDLAPTTIWRSIRRRDQGFVTTRGRWLSRSEAWRLAKKRGQLRWDCSREGVTPELHSENLRQGRAA